MMPYQTTRRLGKLSSWEIQPRGYFAPFVLNIFSKLNTYYVIFFIKFNQIYISLLFLDYCGTYKCLAVWVHAPFEFISAELLEKSPKF